MPMPLDQWRQVVSAHLDMIGAGADICVRHAERLLVRPGFETLAEMDLKRAEAVLQEALTKVRLAQAIYRDKEIGT
jgi:hypothetical protein